MEGIQRTRWITRMALLVAMATLLHTLERTFLTPFLWARLGVANVVTLLALILFGFKEAVIITCLRSLLGSIMAGMLFTPAFVLGLAGAIMATLVMGLFHRHPVGLSLIGISILGAVANNLMQLVMVTFLITRHIGTLIHLPLLMMVALLGGFFNGVMITFLIQYLPAEVTR